MDRLDIAQRRYRQIVPDDGAPISLSQGMQLADWLEQDVCAVVSTDATERSKMAGTGTYCYCTFLIKLIQPGRASCARLNPAIPM